MIWVDRLALIVLVPFILALLILLGPGDHLMGQWPIAIGIFIGIPWLGLRIIHFICTAGRSQIILRPRRW